MTMERFNMIQALEVRSQTIKVRMKRGVISPATVIDKGFDWD